MVRTMTLITELVILSSPYCEAILLSSLLGESRLLLLCPSCQSVLPRGSHADIRRRRLRRPRQRPPRRDAAADTVLTECLARVGVREGGRFFLLRT